MAILITRSFEKADRRKVSGLHRIKEISHVVLMVSRVTAVSYRLDRRRPRMSWVGGRRIVLKWFMVWNVVGNHLAADRRNRRPFAAGCAVFILHAQIEAAAEPSPCHVGLVQQVADVVPAHGNKHARRRGANVADRVRVANQGVRAISPIGKAALSIADIDDAVRLTRYQIDRARRRWPEGRPEGIVAHRKALGVIPHRGHRIAIEIPHRQAGRVQRRSLVSLWRIPLAHRFRKQIHQSGMEGKLFCGVIVILVCGRGLRSF